MVASSGTPRTTSDGMPTTSSSTSGKRSRFAKRGRPSITTARKPSGRASVTSGMATWVAPTTASVGAGMWTSTNARTSPRLTVREAPVANDSSASRTASASSAGSPSVPVRRPSSSTRSFAPAPAASRRVTIAPARPVAAWAFKVS